MDTFFRRHFKKKNADRAPGGGGAIYCRHRRPSVAVTTSKARRRSSVGLPSVVLTQRRRSSVQLQGLLPATVGCCIARTARRRSSTTAPRLHPRFAVRRRRGGKPRTIDAHLLGSSLLLASLIQMTEDGRDLRAGEQQVAVRGAGCEGTPSPSDSEGSEGDSEEDWDSRGDSEGSGNEVEASGDECLEPSGSDRAEAMGRELEDTSVTWDRREGAESEKPRPLIRAPRCLRRNSSHPQLFEGYYSHGLYGGYRHAGQLRRVTSVSKGNSPWPGRGAPGRRRAMAARRVSLSPYRNCSACWRTSDRRGSLSPLPSTYYDPQLETWSGFLSYVDHYFHRGH